MSKLHPSKRRRGSRAEAALSELCIRLGYCIPPAEQEAILANPPPDAEAFVDAVLIAEEHDPNLVLKEQRRPMLEIVTNWLYDDGHGRGSMSDLPRFPFDG
jgi:hypothetical protein